MSAISLSLPSNALHPSSQILELNKIAAFIGGNGAGKSSILESIFTSGLERGDYLGKKIVCFSSGQNEKYSNHFSKYLAKERKAQRGLNLGCCYYDKSWSRMLIFLASIDISGHVRNFLHSKGYVELSADGDDITSELVVSVKVDQPYVNRVQNALKQEENGEIATFRQSAYHRTLESFIHSVVDSDYEFDEPLNGVQISVNYSNAFTPNYTTRDDEFFDEKVNFYTQAADNNYFFDRASMELKLANNIELKDLSDGEYQILFLYALLDLFDSKETLFLLDEVDSHLHYINVDNLWKALHQIKGYALTTTHLLDSITAPENGFEQIVVVEGGCIREENKTKAVLERLGNLSRMKSVQFEVCRKLENIVLMDDYNDWLIFLALVKRKGLDVGRLSKINVVKQASGCNSPNEPIGEKKIQWCESFMRSESTCQTKNVFLICDRDEAHIHFSPNNDVAVLNKQSTERIAPLNAGSKIKIHLLAWKRREIKNYLLSYSGLLKNGLLKEVNNKKIGEDYHLKENDPGDNDHIRDLSVKSYITKVIDTAGVGLDVGKLDSYLENVPDSEISEDIANMYNFLVGKCGV